MSAEFWPGESEFNPRLPTERLILYIHGQFMDAVQKEFSEGSRGQDALNGTFIQRVPLEAGHPLLKGSRRIVLKPPHPQDVPGVHSEVYAVRLDEDSRHLSNADYLEAVDLYVVRDYMNGEPGPYMLVNSSGVHSVDMRELDLLDRPEFDIESITPDPQRELLSAQEMFQKYTGYNIVAVTD